MAGWWRVQDKKKTLDNRLFEDEPVLGRRRVPLREESSFSSSFCKQSIPNLTFRFTSLLYVYIYFTLRLEEEYFLSEIDVKYLQLTNKSCCQAGLQSNVILTNSMGLLILFANPQNESGTGNLGSSQNLSCPGYEIKQKWKKLSRGTEHFANFEQIDRQMNYDR